jgi:phage terminase large subunit
MNVLWKPHKGPQTLALATNETVWEILFGGSRGGGKSDTGIVWLLKAAHNPDFVGLVIRRNHSDLRNWIDRARQLFTNATVSGKPPVFHFKGGGKIFTGHLKDKDAFSQFQGWNINRLLLEEAGQIPDEQSYLKLISSVRSTSNVKTQIFLTANPGGPGHNWLKLRFGIGKKEPNKAFKDPISGRYRMYIPATIDDNPTLKNADPAYVMYLQSLPEPLKSAWLYGDWEIFAGQYFAEWNPAYHVQDLEKCKELGFGDENNNKYISIDWGFAAPHAVMFLEVTPKGRVFVFDEIYGKEKHPMELGEMIYKKCQGLNITQSLGDPSMWSRNPMSWRQEHTAMYTDKSIAHALMGDMANPLVPNLMPANNDRVNGFRMVSQLMKVEEGKDPNFIVVKGTCPNLVRTIPEMICDEKRPEDLDTTLEDHAVDALRYGIVHAVSPDIIKKKKSKDQLKYESLLEPTPESWNYQFGD